ncbi:MAG: tetratricopeptide repeat protein [Bacteroidetes bacterium]|nr:tetratricopeptide repeat protein [Bacteroidota bacterium]
MAKKHTPARTTQKPAQRPAATPKKAADESSNRSWYTFGFIVLAITAACYWPSLSNKLVNWDDDPNITENPNIERVGQGITWGETVKNIFDVNTGNVIGNYNPLPILSFAVEKSLAGNQISPRLIHTTNLLLHLGTVWLVMLLLFRMGFGNWGVLVGGLLFGIHPMRVESVAWATERKDVLFAIFFFAALALYDRWVKREGTGQPRMGLYIGMMILALLSGFSKVQAVTLPLSMLALDYWYRRPIGFKLILEKTPFWIISLIIGSMNLYTLKQQGSTNDDITNFNFLDRLCIGAYSFCVYLYKLFLPWPMSPLYPYPKPLPIWVYLSPILFAAVWYGVWRLWKADKRVWVFGVLFFFFNVMFLLQVLGAGQGFLADRFTYVPYFGFFAIAAWYFQENYADASKRGLLNGLLGVLVLVCGVWTVRQIAVWENGATLWTHVISLEGKSNSLPYWNRGQYFREKGDFESAIKDYNQGVIIEPTSGELLNSRGKTYFDMAMSGKYKAQTPELMANAMKDYTNALNGARMKEGTRAEVLINRGAAQGAAGQFQQAIADLTEGIRIDPKNKNGYFNRSIAYYSTQQYDKALVDYDAYLKLDPFNANVWYESGMIQRSMNKNQEAIQALTKAIQLNPNIAVAYLERARAYAQSGNKAAAQQDYQRAQQMGVKLESMDQRMLEK